MDVYMGAGGGERDGELPGGGPHPPAASLAHTCRRLPLPTLAGSVPSRHPQATSSPRAHLAWRRTRASSAASKHGTLSRPVRYVVMGMLNTGLRRRPGGKNARNISCWPVSGCGPASASAAPPSGAKRASTSPSPPLPRAPPRSSSSSGAAAAKCSATDGSAASVLARPATVGLRKNAAMSACASGKRFRTADSSRIASRLVPPTAKKSTPADTSSLCASTRVASRCTHASSRELAAINSSPPAALLQSTSGSALRATLPLGSLGSDGSGTSAAGTMCAGSTPRSSESTCERGGGPGHVRGRGG
eukprot:206302-Chlamydomonas_euryale.AAC.3